MFNSIAMLFDISHYRDSGSEKKTVTIRGVDKHLYDQFVSLAGLTGSNIGHIFSFAIQSYTKDTHMFFPRHFRRIVIHKQPEESIELIDNQSELILSKADLTSAGNHVSYMFKNIDRLVFDESVDNSTLLHHVNRIRKCNVEALGEISKLFLLSIDQSNINKLPISTDLQNITIRNVSSVAYDEFVSNCQTNKKNIGECMNELLSEIIPHFEVIQILTHNLSSKALNPIVLSLHNKIIVTQEDLEALEERMVLFHRVHDLEFTKKIKNDTFIKSVLGIYNCERVKLPSDIPKLIKIARVKNYPS
jgi:hypothetical protein